MSAADRPARHPREQRRHRPRRHGADDDGRRSRSLYAVNVRGMLNVTKAYLPEWSRGEGRDREHGVGRRAGGDPGSAGLCDDEVRRRRHDQVHGARSRRSGVRINCICPGRVETPWVSARVQSIPIPRRPTGRWRRRRRWGGWGSPKRSPPPRCTWRATRRRSSRVRPLRSMAGGRVSVCDTMDAGWSVSATCAAPRPYNRELLLQGDSLRSRSLWNSKGVATVNPSVCLGFGIGLNATIFSVIDGVLLQAIPLHRSGQDPRGWRAESAHRQSIRPVVSRHAGLEGGRLGLHYDCGRRGAEFDDCGPRGEPERYLGAAVSWDLFPLLGTSPILGRGFTSKDDRPEPVRSCCSVTTCGPGATAVTRRSSENRSSSTARLTSWLA